MKKKMVWIAVSCLMVVALVLTGSQTPAAGKTKKAVDKGPQYGGVISLVTDSFVNIDPYRFHAGSTAAASYFCDKLTIGDWAIDRDVFGFTVGRGANPESVLAPSLAENWNMPDPKTIILKIRQGVHWHDKAPTHGRAFTVDDVIYNIDGWWRKSPFIDRQFSDLIESVKKLDNWTIEIRLKPPAKVDILVGVLDNDSHFFVAEESRNTPSGEIVDWKMASGTGPFVLTDLVADSVLRFKRNPNYWGFDEKNPQNKLPYVDEVKYLIIPDVTTRLAAIRTGKVDIAFEIDIKDTLNLIKTNPKLKHKAIYGTAPRALRMRWDLHPFNDLKMRQAVSMAIDRQAIIDSVYQGQAGFYSGLLKPVHVDVYTPFEKLPQDIRDLMTYNPEKAKQLVKEAGYPKGIKVNLNIGPNPDFSELAAIIQQYLKVVGINVQIIRNEWPEFNALRYGKQHKHLIIHWNSFYAQPLQLFEWFADPTHKFGLSAVNDPVFTAKYQEATQTFDNEKRFKLIRELDYYSLRDVFFATLPDPQIGRIWQPWIGGYQGEGALGQFNYGALAARIWVIDELKD